MVVVALDLAEWLRRKGGEKEGAWFHRRSGEGERENGEREI